MDVFVELRAIISDFQAKMAAARGEMDATSKSGGSSFASLSTLSKGALLGVAAAAAGVAVASVKAASDFDAAMELIATQAGAPQSEVDALKNKVLDLAGPTATAPIVLADALYHIESVGLRSAQAMDVLKLSAEGAKVGHADLTQTTTALTAAIASGIKGTKDYSQAMGALNAIVGAGDMTMQDLNDAMGTGIVVIAKQFGLSLTDVGGALATFGDNNIRGADAATKLRQSIMDLSQQGPKGAGALGEIGIQAGQLTKDMGTGGLGAALVDLKNHLNAAGITGAALGGFLTEAFTKRSAAPLGILLDQLDRFKSKQVDIAAGANQFGADWTATTQNFQFKMQQAQASAEALGIKLGNFLIPIIEQLMGFISQIVAWFEKHKTAAENLGIALGVLAAALLVAGAAAFIAANALTLGIGLAVAAIIIAILYLATHWQEVWADIKRWTDDFIAFMRSGFGTLIILMTGIFAPLLLLALHWQQVWEGMKVAARDFIGFFTALPGELAGVGDDLVGIAADIGKGIANYFIFGINGIIRAWNHLMGLLKIPAISLPFGLGSFGGIDIGGGLKIDQIAYLAQGGIVLGPTLAMLGEKGKEAVVPLDKLGGLAGGGGDLVFTIDGTPFARVAIDLLARESRNRPLPIKVQ